MKKLLIVGLLGLLIGGLAACSNSSKDDSQNQNQNQTQNQPTQQE